MPMAFCLYSFLTGTPLSPSLPNPSPPPWGRLSASALPFSSPPSSPSRLLQASGKVWHQCRTRSWPWSSRRRWGPPTWGCPVPSGPSAASWRRPRIRGYAGVRACPTILENHHRENHQIATIYLWMPFRTFACLQHNFWLNHWHDCKCAWRRLTCLVFCRLTMANFPPLRLVRSGRSPLGLICMDVPSVSARSARLQRRRYFTIQSRTCSASADITLNSLSLLSDKNCWVGRENNNQDWGTFASLHQGKNSR